MFSYLWPLWKFKVWTRRVNQGWWGWEVWSLVEMAPLEAMYSEPHPFENTWKAQCPQRIKKQQQSADCPHANFLIMVQLLDCRHHDDVREGSRGVNPFSALQAAAYIRRERALAKSLVSVCRTRLPFLSRPQFSLPAVLLLKQRSYQLDLGGQEGKVRAVLRKDKEAQMSWDFYIHTHKCHSWRDGFCTAVCFMWLLSVGRDATWHTSRADSLWDRKKRP